VVRVCAEAAIAAARHKATTKEEEMSLNLLTIVSERFRRNEEGGVTLAWNAARHYVEYETQVSMCRILQTEVGGGRIQLFSPASDFRPDR
jgi:hypothetical protein